MARWKELPASLTERERQLVVQLRRLKDHSGLGLASLAARTSYSRSSWERYLNGKLSVPREAVVELTRVCGADPTRLLVLHEVVTASAGTTGATAPPADPDGGPALDPDPDPDPAPERRPRLVPLRFAVAGAALAVAVAFGAGLLAGGAWWGGQERGRGVYAYEKGRTYDCADGREDGARYAGHSLTREALLDRGGSGWEVVEAQCLLKRAGFGAGAVDGAYGEGTKKAVTRFQRARGLVDDGIVGPDTWGELRK
ncbi:peptidoglycan-binding protein [Streptomyces sp. NPDC052114]|uniref:peptidoglycan-binding protein n=1 Tax=unclassified Streptomyces TaxID=2593676 RepID=UPI003431B25C